MRGNSACSPLARPFLLAFEWAPTVQLPTAAAGIRDIKHCWCKINLLLYKGSGGQDSGHPAASAAPISAPATLVGAPKLCCTTAMVTTALVPDQIWCTTCTTKQADTRKQDTVTDHQLFFPRPFALGPKLPTANMSGCLLQDAWQCFSPRSFAASSPTIGVGDQSFLAAATEQQAPALPGASGCLPWHQVVAPPTATSNQLHT